MSFMDRDFEPAAEDQRSPRERRLIRAEMVDAYGGQYDIVIRNVSERGVGVSSSDQVPATGTSVTVILPHGVTAAGVVRWVNGKSFGISLENSVEASVWSEAVQRKLEASREGGNWEVRRQHKVPSAAADPNRLRRI